MLHPSVEPAEFTILTVPGLDGSGPEHWQTLWEYDLPYCRRAEMPDWGKPRRPEWTEALDRAITAARAPTILVGHSLGCLAIAWWAKEKGQLTSREHVLGGLLVAPPCVEAECASERLLDFRPAPRTALPFPTLLVASHDDPYASLAASGRLAAMWGSQFADAGKAGHINAASGLGRWDHGLVLLRSLMTRALAAPGAPSSRDAPASARGASASDTSTERPGA